MINKFENEILDLDLNKIKINRITGTDLRQYKGDVFDLEVFGYKNYQTRFGLAHNGGGKRHGAIAIYLNCFHFDIEQWLMLKINQGREEYRARDLFYALWVSDLFMERVENDEMWTLFDPNTAPGLDDLYGEDFKELYCKYEKEGRGKKIIKAQILWKKIMDTQIETSMPYILYKDAVNRKTNQKNVGTIKSSNLCAEVCEFTSPDEIAVCNLASISLSSCVEGQSKPRFNHKRLYEIVKTAVKNLNKVIDLNHYPLPEAERSNMRHRPIGLGVQGLADVFIKCRVNWGSFVAFKLNREIFETIYYAAVEASMEEAMRDGNYESYIGSPISEGKFQFDLWFDERLNRWGEGLSLSENEQRLSKKIPSNGEELYCTSGRYDWQSLRNKVIEHGLRNSLLLANMPTASTSSILGNTEAFEPIPSNIYKRNVLSGEFVRINSYLVADLQMLGLWNEEIKQKIVAAEGSIQGIAEIPEEVRELYRTVWEIKQRHIIDLAADRGAFICQSQSLNIYMSNPTFSKLTSMHFYGWKKGLKTGSYYIRQQAARQAQKFTVDVNIENKLKAQQELYKKALDILKEKEWQEEDLKRYSTEEIISLAQGICSLDNPEDCEMCGS